MFVIAESAVKTAIKDIFFAAFFSFKKAENKKLPLLHVRQTEFFSIKKPLLFLERSDLFGCFAAIRNNNADNIDRLKATDRYENRKRFIRAISCKTDIPRLTTMSVHLNFIKKM